MKHSLFVAALASAALVSLPFDARAQVSTIAKPVQIGIAGGAAIPTSDLSDISNTGYNGTITVGFNPALVPFGIRVDGAYNQFGVKSILGGGNIHVTSATGNIFYKIPGATVSPYGIGGAGWYNLGGSGGTQSESDFGWNIGGGISMALSGFDTFIEARYNQIQTKPTAFKYIPVTFGVMF